MLPLVHIASKTIVPRARFAGQLMSYAPDFVEQNRRLATFVDRILRDANPGELPSEQSTEIKLVVNLKTARALGITLPPAILILATEFIE